MIFSLIKHDYLAHLAQNFMGTATRSKVAGSFVALSPKLSAWPLMCLLTSPTAAHAETLDIASFTSLAERCGSSVAALTLAAIAKTESRFETLVVADNNTRRARTYKTIEQAESAAKRLIAKGHSVDLGLMQINSANLKRLKMTVRDVLEPCGGIRAGASILTGNFRASNKKANKQVVLRDALSMYNTGNRTYGYKNGYVGKVEKAAISLAAHFSAVDTETPALRVSIPHIEETSQPSGPWDVWRPAPSQPPLEGQQSDTIHVF